MNTEKIVEELERENAFLRHEMWMVIIVLKIAGGQTTKHSNTTGETL